jgi:hypothetical protein
MLCFPQRVFVVFPSLAKEGTFKTEFSFEYEPTAHCGLRNPYAQSPRCSRLFAYTQKFPSHYIVNTQQLCRDNNFNFVAEIEHPVYLRIQGAITAP